MSFNIDFEKPTCNDCGSTNLDQTDDPTNPQVAFQWCEDCGEVQ